MWGTIIMIQEYEFDDNAGTITKEYLLIKVQDALLIYHRMFALLR